MKKLPLMTGIASLMFATVTQAQIDVVFKIDESGSMEDEIVEVQQNITTIFNALPSGSHAGLIGYGGRHISNAPHIHTSLTSDQTIFQNAVDQL